LSAGGTTINLYAVISDVIVYLVVQSPFTSDLWYAVQPDVILKEGDQIKASLIGNALNDNFRVTYAGYKMDVDL
jgi:hypothetical protein